MKNKAFTLAEVLITLTIIGVVAAMSIPSLLSSIQYQENASKVLKINTVLTQAFMMYEQNNGCLGNITSCGLFSPSADDIANWAILKTHFNILKDCSFVAGRDCFPAVPYKWLKNESYWPYGTYGNNTVNPSFLLSDGIAVILENNHNECTGTVGSVINVCGKFSVDINGPKDPNKLGRDFFQWLILKDGNVIPLGAQDSVPGDTCDPSTSQGWGCTKKVVLERAMNY